MFHCYKDAIYAESSYYCMRIKFEYICRFDTLKQRGQNYPSVPALLEVTGTTIDIGFSSVKEGFLLKMQTPENGDTTAARKR